MNPDLSLYDATKMIVGKDLAKWQKLDKRQESRTPIIKKKEENLQ